MLLLSAAHALYQYQSLTKHIYIYIYDIYIYIYIYTTATFAYGSSEHLAYSTTHTPSPPCPSLFKDYLLPAIPIITIREKYILVK